MLIAIVTRLLRRTLTNHVVDNSARWQASKLAEVVGDFSRAAEHAWELVTRCYMIEKASV